MLEIERQFLFCSKIIMLLEENFLFLLKLDPQQRLGQSDAGPIKASAPMWRCSRIMHTQRELHPTILASLEEMVDRVSSETTVKFYTSVDIIKDAFFCDILFCERMRIRCHVLKCCVVLSLACES